MFRSVCCAVALATAAVPASAQDAELSKLREALRQLQQQVQQLETRLQEAEAKSSEAEQTAVQAAAQASSRPQSESALNPGISAILNGVYANLSKDPNTYRINGFVPTLGEVSPGKRGFSLGESELGVMANVDHVFRGTLIASISPDNSSIDVEEGYIQTLGLSKGFSIKAGRFFSAVGYQNQIHAHAWDFTDTPLAMKAFLGNQLNEDGVQFKWVAPTDLYVDVGVEFGQRTQHSPPPSATRTASAPATSSPTSAETSERAMPGRRGLSYLSTSPQDRVFDDVDSLGTGVTNSFSGNSKLWVVDGVLKWSPDGNPTYKNFKLQGEYFRRKEDGSLTYDTLAQSQGTMTGSYLSTQSGWYLQGVYQFIPQWRVGLPL